MSSWGSGGRLDNYVHDGARSRSSSPSTRTSACRLASLYRISTRGPLYRPEITLFWVRSCFRKAFCWSACTPTKQDHILLLLARRPTDGRLGDMISLQETIRWSAGGEMIWYLSNRPTDGRLGWIWYDISPVDQPMVVWGGYDMISLQ